MTRYVLIALVSAATLCSSVAQAQLPVSVRVRALGAMQDVEFAAFVGDTELGTATATSYGVGGEIQLGLPAIGFKIGALYLRHFGDLDGLDASSSALSFGLGANEIGGFIEKHFVLAPMSPIKPFVGAGAGYSRVSLVGDLDTVGVSASGSLDASANVGRIYGVAGIELLGGMGLSARAGYSFSSGTGIDFGQTLTTPLGDDLAFEVEYDGFFGSLGLSLFGF